MAGDFDFISSEPTVQLVPPNRVRQMRFITARAKPSGVVFFFPVLPVDAQPLQLGIQLKALAEKFNALAARPGVVGVTVEQSLSSGDALTQKVVVTVESASGNSADDVTLSWGEAQGLEGYKKLAAARAELNELEAL